MKSNQLVETKNVKKAIAALNFLLTRPKTEIRGLGLIYGVPGSGKSRFARRCANQNNFIYMSLVALESAPAFAKELYRKLKERYNLTDKVRGSGFTMFQKCVSAINRATKNEDVVIFIDEVDYAFENHRLLGTIRDIVDNTVAIVMLVGEENAHRSLLKANPRYFDRCNCKVPFENLDSEDTKQICKHVSDVELEAEIITRIFSYSKGIMRKTMKKLHLVETVAKRKELTKPKYEEVKEAFDVAD